MRVREWNPRSAPPEELEALVTTLNAAFAKDLPEDPRWRGGTLREYLSEMMPGERRVCWLADRPGAVALGHANLLRQGDTGVLEVVVHPSARRHGAGRALVTTAARRAAAEEISSLGVEVVADTPAVSFWEALGLRCAYVELRSILDLRTVDWDGIGKIAEAVPAGYRVEHYRGALPTHLLEPYAVAKAARRQLDPPDLELHPSSYDARRLAASLETLDRRGMKPYLVLAVQETSGVVAALTEVVTASQHPTRADQYDTVVIPEHQGLGLDRVIKARMLRELRTAKPGLQEVQTWNALGDEPLLRINTELGFRPDRQWCEYQGEVRELLEALGPPPAG